MHHKFMSSPVPKEVNVGDGYIKPAVFLILIYSYPVERVLYYYA